MATHILKYDGYLAGDTMLDGCIFNVSLEIDELNVKIGEITPDDSAYPYVEMVAWKDFVPFMVEDLEERIDHLRKCFKEEGITFEDEFKVYEEDTGEPGVQAILHL